MNAASSPPNTGARAHAVATLVFDGEALRQALVETLTDPRVIERLAAAMLAQRTRGAATTGAPSKYMAAKEYAQHARISPRSLDYMRQSMTEGVHYSRVGRRIRFHVAEADELISRSKRAQPHQATESAKLKDLARQEAARRRIKLASTGDK